MFFKSGIWDWDDYICFDATPLFVFARFYEKALGCQKGVALF